MKKRLAIILSVFTVMTALSGCDDGSAKTSVEANNMESTEATSEASTEESTADASSETSEDAVDGAAAADSASTEATEDTQNAQDTPADSAQTATTVAPEEVVEPELSEETIENPVQVEEVKEEDDAIHVVFMGDSQFDNARGTGSEIPAYTASLIPQKTKVYNLAIGGTPASLERNATDALDGWSDTCFVGMAYALAGKVDRSFLDKYEARAVMDTIDPAKVDFYVIEYGANDYINGKDLSSPNTSFDVRTFRGALEVGINTLKEVSPNAKFILCSPSYCLWYNADGYALGDSYTVSKGIGTLSDYADMVNNVCEDGGYTYVDTMYATYFDLKATTVDSYLSDGLHYKELGRQIYATTIAHFINKALGTDPEPMSYIEIDNFSFGS